MPKLCWLSERCAMPPCGRRESWRKGLGLRRESVVEEVELLLVLAAAAEASR